MTMESLEPAAPSTQDATSLEGDLKSLVRGLAEQAEAADQRAKAADQRCDELTQQATDLAERVGLLEGQRGTSASSETRLGSTRGGGGGRGYSLGHGTIGVSFVRQEEELTEDGDDGRLKLKSVTGVPEDDVEEALTDRVTLIERRLENYDDEEKDLLDERKYALPESTFSLLITHHPLSGPFAFAVFSAGLSISCLFSLTLASSIKKGSQGNPLGMPAGVDSMVRGAQFLGAIVGVLMEDEIPQGLQLIANGAGHTLLLNGQKKVQKRVIISSIFRLIVGYLFLSSLFINIAQNIDVIAIFYDVLALEFVENIDDTAYALAKRGFFGRTMLVATNETYNLHLTGTRQSVLVRTRGAPTISERIITARQHSGQYRCKTISVLLDEDIWERAHVELPDGSTEERLLYIPTLMVSTEEGFHNGYPKYIEQNKNDGKEFGSSVTGAEISYCDEIKSWIFNHPYITTSANGGDGNECSWLLRSPDTDSYDILSTSDAGWEVWLGEVKPLAQVSITCNECTEKSDCNYHGSCGKDKVCDCIYRISETSVNFRRHVNLLPPRKPKNLVRAKCVSSPHFRSIARCSDLIVIDLFRYFITDPEKGTMQWKQENPISLIDDWSQQRVYNRPVYIQKGLSGEPFDMRLYKLLEEDKSSSPSNQPSNVPSISFIPTPFPSQSPTVSPTEPPMVQPTLSPTTKEPTMSPTTEEPTLSPPATPTKSPIIPKPTNSPYPTFEATGWSTPTVGYDKTSLPTSIKSFTPFPTNPSYLGGKGVAFERPKPTPPPAPIHSQNEYDTASDFEDWDDLFESKHLHNLEDMLEDYSVIIFFSGSRFYGTIIEPNATFICISLKIIMDFGLGEFDNVLNPNVQFEYGPYGVQIPLMNFQGAGFFHCLDVTPQPSNSPSYSAAPTSTAAPSQTPSGMPASAHPSTSPSPTDECFLVDINILHDAYPCGISWNILMITAAADGSQREKIF